MDIVDNCGGGALGRTPPPAATEVNIPVNDNRKSKIIANNKFISLCKYIIIHQTNHNNLRSRRLLHKIIH